MKHRCFRAACGKILSFILALLLLSGCANQGETLGELPLSKDMPPALTRGHMRESSFNAKLYFITEDGRSLSAENRVINCDGGMSRAEAAIRALQNGPESDALTRAIPHGLIFNGLELSHDVCNVYFSGSLPGDSRAWLAMRAALSATVRAVEGIGTVNVYFDGYEPGYAGKALGALAPISAALDTYLSNMRQQYEPLLDESTEAGAFETRLATLYFTDLSGKLLIAANRSISYDAKLDKSSLAAMLLSNLLEGDTSSGRFEPVLPADLLLAAPPIIKYEAVPVPPPPSLPSSWTATPTTPPANVEETPEQPEADETVDLDEACVIELVFKKPQLEYNQKMMCGAITLMLTGYIPKVKGVRISILNENGLADNLGDKEYFERKDFSASIGHSISLAFPDSEGAALRKVERIVPSWNTYVPLMRLSELFKGPADPGVLHPLFSEEHVRTVYVTGDLAVVDWEEGFMDTLKQLAETERVYAPGTQPERLFIYGVVNTLTEIPGVNRVWMLENGQKLGMIGDMYLGNALLRNPGILLGG